MTVRWGLIGAGDIARKRVAPALRDLPNCDLVAVSRARAEMAESFAKEFGARRWYADWQELLADDDIDAVYVATPVSMHAEQTIAAAEAGKHVLCEKPMALTVAECDAMIAAAQANGVKLGVAYYRHHYPVIARMRQLIASGDVGQVVLCQINAFEWFNPEPEHPRHWLIEKEHAGGGPMFDFGCHRLEILVDLFGPVGSLTSMLGKVVFDREVEDTAIAVLEHATGTRSVLSVTHAAKESRDTVDIFGTLGSLHVPVLNGGTLRIRRGDDEVMESHPPATNIHLPLIEDFADAVLVGREPVVNGEIGRLVAELEERIYSGA